MERPVASRATAVRLGAELLPMLLVLASLAGTLALVIAMYRRPRPARQPAPPAIVYLPVRPAPPPPPVVPPPPPAPVDDPTPGLLAALDARKAEHANAAEQADRKAKALVEALRAPLEDSARRRRRAMLARAQVRALDERVSLLETEAEVLELERDVLGRERDAAKAALARAKARARSGYALLPYKGANGTWRRPIAIECRNGMAVLEPGGPSFTLLELAAIRGVRSSRLVAEILHAAAKLQGTTGPDGAPVVPYVLFVVRPDGIRPFYEARGRLEPLGIVYGYELIDQDWEIEYPELDDPSVWDSVPSPRAGLVGAPTDRPGAGGRGAVGSSGWLGTGLRDPGRVTGEATSRGLEDQVPATPRPLQNPPRTALGSLSTPMPGSGGAPGPTVPRPAIGGGLPPGSTRVEIVPRDHAGLFDLEPVPAPDRHRPSMRDLGESSGVAADAQEGIGRRGGLGELSDLEPVPGAGGSGGGHAGRTPRVERPLDLVIACGPKGVTIHPGGYRLTVAVLDAEDGRLVETLRTIVQARRTVEPGVSWRPTLRFLVESGGQGPYWTARRQTLLAGLDWPASLRVAEAETVRTFKWERW